MDAKVYRLTLIGIHNGQSGKVHGSIFERGVGLRAGTFPCPFNLALHYWFHLCNFQVLGTYATGAP